jgi:cytochrome c oxidase assembly factor CtaG
MRLVTGPDAVVSERVPTTSGSQEATVTTGFILLVLIGVVVAFGWTRLRGRMKMKVSGKDWIGPIVIVFILGLMLWASQGGH